MPGSAIKIKLLPSESSWTSLTKNLPENVRKTPEDASFGGVGVGWGDDTNRYKYKGAGQKYKALKTKITAGNTEIPPEARFMVLLLEESPWNKYSLRKHHMWLMGKQRLMER